MIRMKSGPRSAGRPGSWALLFPALMLAALVAACGSSTPAVEEGQAAGFELITYDGRRLSLGDLEGQAVVLNFWATWCAPCRTEMPHFESTYREYKQRGVVFVGVAMADDPEASKSFLRELGITYPNGPDDDSEISSRYGVVGLPTTVFIGRDGKVARTWAGTIDKERLVALVEEIAR
ncbi:MAG: TlpA family protein disulfide reductase [Actinomycetota bacterium]|nr:TlpA family protein disulfide reductase [Actinomycetota bacterium]